MSSLRQLHPVTLALAVMVTAAATLSAAQQQPEAFPALPSCPPAPLSLSPCIGYVFGVSSATLTDCCSQLRSFLQAQAPCLCAASKLAPSPVGLILGQAQTIIPNVCHLPNPCDADAGDGEGSASPPSETTTTPAATTPATEEPSSSTAAADPDASGASPEPAEDSPAAATAPAGAGYKLPQLLHAAGATRSRGMAAGTVFITVFLASVATLSV
ncbi:hypothetical protein SEVIR_9G146300v4 [Setaria viridis]|uniref:Bifunctional inhibitor/plant lipid transfer protein/seed storage helical domain-containing protein n=2 Tax=Setaria TaxID=4554 RepID=K4AF22_SETIT|nr:non-specific lipid-transfer protein-like protein At2g13820 [Setaria italica]XP_004982235.1 non-specific lipid-transfer protein-like protein At2g13820 [Setaria italica]XP_034575923.1 non-specific lipid-transfer protein-like protein At2g13820 [Setaria viridis]XP_034575924.1 non-specific lipid-transfer protein-like protein At2g13820 [Setaria viridis]RCV41576.1 hypothetical protein SETIT_9G147800v2 [Setaria italica]RCV41577.1 hypothetical protein SETIT_9G147800v2 [Setaria italica]TKV92168.1 hy